MTWLNKVTLTLAGELLDTLGRELRKNVKGKEAYDLAREIMQLGDRAHRLAEEEAARKVKRSG